MSLIVYEPPRRIVTYSHIWGWNVGISISNIQEWGWKTRLANMMAEQSDSYLYMQRSDSMMHNKVIYAFVRKSGQTLVSADVNYTTPAPTETVTYAPVVPVEVMFFDGAICINCLDHSDPKGFTGFMPHRVPLADPDCVKVAAKLIKITSMDEIPRHANNVYHYRNKSYLF